MQNDILFLWNIHSKLIIFVFTTILVTLSYWLIYQIGYLSIRQANIESLIED